jgi:hypothetical protein
MSVLDYSSSIDSTDGGGSNLTAGILDSVTQLGTAAIYASAPQPTIRTGYPYAPPLSTSSIFTGSPIGGTGTGSGLLWVFLFAAVVIGFFAFRR